MHHSSLIQGKLSTPESHVGGLKAWLHARIRNLNTRWSWVVNCTLRSLYARKVTSVPIGMETRWSPEPIWVLRSKEKSLSAAGIRTPDRPTRSLVITTTTLSQLRLSSCNIHFNMFPGMPNLQIVPSLSDFKTKLCTQCQIFHTCLVPRPHHPPSTSFDNLPNIRRSSLCDILHQIRSPESSG
jgi:hypothetical protein